MRNLFGIAIVLFGLGLLAQSLNLPNASRLLDLWWPSIIIVCGLLMWNANRRAWFGSFVIVLIGVAILLERFEVLQTSAWNIIWPTIIIVIGARMLLGRNGPIDVKTEQTTDANVTVMFSGADKTVGGRVSQANVSAWFGGAKLDLRKADIVDGAVITVNAAFAGVDIFVPSDVNVSSKIVPIFGGVDDKSDHSKSRITVTLEGSALFGGVGIKN